MEVLYPRCAGLDVHKDSRRGLCALRIDAGAREVQILRRRRAALLELNEWLSSHAVTHVAMEATGVYWKPVWHILEEDFELVLANAAAHPQCPGPQDRRE